MIPHGRRAVTTAQFATETGLSTSQINELIKARGVHCYGFHAQAPLYDHRQLQAAHAGREKLPEIAPEHDLDRLTIADIAAMAGQPPNTWTVYHRRQIGPMKGRKPDWTEPKDKAKKADGTKRPPVEYWHRKTAREIVDNIGPEGWVKGRARPASRGVAHRPPAPELEQVVALLAEEPGLSGVDIAARLDLNARKAQRLRKQALDRLGAAEGDGRRQPPAG